VRKNNTAMRIRHLTSIAALLAGAMMASGQQGRGEPRAGYVYPAGACRGTTVEVIVGGQNLRQVDAVRVSGTGVEATVIKTYRAVRNMDGDQRALLKWRIACRHAEIDGRPKPAAPPPPKPNPDGTPAAEVVLPEQPLLDLLDDMSAVEITHWMTVQQRRDRLQPAPQLGELARISIKVAANAAPGMRELRLVSPQGLSNPLRFEIGTLKEIVELEPNEPQSEEDNMAAVPVPCTFNGQIQSGDVDVLKFQAKRGRTLVVRSRARALIPYLADAVPGWFQMVMSVRDSKGREVAYGDDFRFDPDPVLVFKVPEDGEYVLEIRDSIFRGREDFVYRVSIGELPFVTAHHPLGGRAGEPLELALIGWNLPTNRLAADTSEGGPPVRFTRASSKLTLSNRICFAVDVHPEVQESEPNADANQANPLSFPCVVNGRIDKPGDVDVFRLEGRSGMTVVVDVQARRLDSPLDSVVHVADESGRILGWNDDSMEKDGHLHLGDGLLTHHADSRLVARVVEDGPVYVRIADVQGRGGPDFGYRLRLVPPEPDFELKVTPSVINAAPGAHVPLQVHVVRGPGFDGEINLSLDGAPAGFSLSGARIPAGASGARLTLCIPPQAKSRVDALRLIGTTGEGADQISRVAEPADDVMQAFLWRHLAPAAEWLVCVAPKRGGRTVLALEVEPPLQIPSGSLAEVRATIPKWVLDRGVELELNDGPPGISLSPIRKTKNGIAFDVIAEKTTAPSGLECNLIIDVFSKQVSGKQAPKPAARSNARSLIGTLPALPIQITDTLTP
jgi:hypothetical protein